MLTWQNHSSLCKRNGQVDSLSAGFPQRPSDQGARGWLSILDTLAGAAEGEEEEGAPDEEGEDEAPCPCPKANTGPPDCSSEATYKTTASPWGPRCEVSVFRQDSRYLWLPKSTKLERHRLAWSSPEKRAMPGLYLDHCHEVKGLLI